MRQTRRRQTASFDNANPDEDFGGTPRVSLRYQPIADLTLRASWGQSFRSPSPGELFLPIIQDFPVLFDPYRWATTLQPPGGVYRGGNTHLQPEKTDAYTAGVVWTPKFLPGFTMTVDWYQLFTTDLILEWQTTSRRCCLPTNVHGSGRYRTWRSMPAADSRTTSESSAIRTTARLFCINSQTRQRR